MTRDAVDYYYGILGLIGIAYVTKNFATNVIYEAKKRLRDKKKTEQNLRAIGIQANLGSTVRAFLRT